MLSFGRLFVCLVTLGYYRPWTKLVGIGVYVGEFCLGSAVSEDHAVYHSS